MIKSPYGKYLKILLCLAAITVLNGCWGARELNALSLVLGIGIDKKNETPDLVYMTAQIVKPAELKKSSASKNGGGAAAKAYWNLESSGHTIFEAIREFTHITNNKLYDAHNEVIIFGRAAAKDGVAKYLDFFVRAQETRPTTLIAVSETTASEALGIMPELDKLPGVNITKLIKAQGFTSHSKEVTLLEFTNSLLSPTTAPVAPYIKIMDINGQKSITIQGLAVFKKDRLAGILSKTETRGLLWAKGLVETGMMDIPIMDGIASIEIKSTSGKMKPEITGDRIQLHIEVKADSVMVAQTCSPNLESVYYVAVLEELQSAAIAREITESLAKALAWNTDYFGFGDLVQKSYHKQWADIEPQWDLIFPAIEVDIAVECKIKATGNITRPIVAE